MLVLGQMDAAGMAAAASGTGGQEECLDVIIVHGGLGIERVI